MSCQSEYQAKKKVFKNWRDFRGKVEVQKTRIHEEEAKYRDLLLTWNEAATDENKVDIDEHLLKDPVDRVELWIKKRIEMEKDITYEGMIDEIESLNDRIAELQLEIDRLESLRGFTEPYVVQSGYTHFELAMQFLVEKHNLTPERASEIIKPVGLWDDLIEGFYVFFLYDESNFYTSVAQGLAKISPNEYKAQLDKIRRKKIEMLTQLYEKEQNEYIKSLDRIKEMRAELSTKTEKLRELEGLYTSLRRNLEYVERAADSLDLAANSVYYIITTSEYLREHGLSKKRFLGLVTRPRLSAFDLMHFSKRFDTRSSANIYLDGRKSHPKVKIYTDDGDLLKKGDDYTMPDPTIIELANPSVYRQRKLLIVLS